MALQQLNPFPLNINPKQDSWDKLQLLQYLDPSLKVTAAELNKIVDALNYLYGNVNVGDYMGNIPIKLQIVNVDHSLPSSTAAKVVAVVNAMPNYLLQNGVAHWFYTQRMVLSSGTGIVAGDLAAASYAVITEYFILGKKIAPVGGSSSIGVGGTPLTVGDLVALPRKDSRNFAPQEFNLGNIGTTTIEQAVNTTGPRATPNTATIIFRAHQNGEEKVWLYLGAQENVGVGFPPVGADVFRLFPADGSGADPEPPSVALKFQVYDDIEEMLIRQREQSRNDLILVMDASEDPTLTFTEAETKLQALYKLKSSVKTEALEDYIVVAAPFHGETFTPSDYDLDDFNNESANKFIRENELPAPPTAPTQTLRGRKSAGTGAIENLSVEEAKEMLGWSEFTHQIIDSGGNYNNLEVTADLLVFTNENAQAIINGVFGKKQFHVLNLSTQYEIRFNHDSPSVGSDAEVIKLPTSSGYAGVSGTARLLYYENYGYFLADTWASLYRPEYAGLTEEMVMTVNENSRAGAMPMKEFIVYRPAQAAPMSKLELNNAYPNSKLPFDVVCPQIKTVYKKLNDENNEWMSLRQIEENEVRVYTEKVTVTAQEVIDRPLDGIIELLPSIGINKAYSILDVVLVRKGTIPFNFSKVSEYDQLYVTSSFYSIDNCSANMRISILNEAFTYIQMIGSASRRIEESKVYLVIDPTNVATEGDGTLDFHITYQIITL